VLLLKPGPLVPPVTSTVPSGRIVALWCRRVYCMAPVLCTTGVRLVEIDDLARVRRRVAAADHEVLAIGRTATGAAYERSKFATWFATNCHDPSPLQSR
jgi:hypothetical protein